MSIWAPLVAAIEWDKLVQVLWTAPLAGIGVTALFSLVIFGSSRAAEAQRNGRGGPATAYGALTGVAFLAFAAGVAFGVYVILSK